MARVIFYPIGNADCTLIHLNDNRLLLVDYACQAVDDGRVRLDEQVRSYLAEQKRREFDAVAFTHADQDHLEGAEQLFWLDHSTKFQGDDRIIIRELHIPANFILEEGLEGTARALRQEARYRLKRGRGIRVYGEPESLAAFLTQAGIDPKTRAHLISRAGELVPGFSREKGGVEIFIHAPFTFRVEEDGTERNENSLLWHMTFFDNPDGCRMLLGADAEHSAWADIVNITTAKRNVDRLKFDLFRISHHCSYTALADEKGRTETKPRPEVEQLFGFAESNCILISSSLPIPTDDTAQPPHKQAASYYRHVASESGDVGNFIVTMEWPSKERPRPLVIDLDENCFTARKTGFVAGGVASVIRQPSPRVGGNVRVL